MRTASFFTNSEAETSAIAQRFARTLRPGDIIAFHGGMGAGKTAFTRGLAVGLGINPRDVSSPTFALIHEYSSEKHTLVHFDMYRITDYDSLYSTGFFEYLETDSILAIEWSENIQEFLPDNRVIITLTPTGENTRTIAIEGSRL